MSTQIENVSTEAKQISTLPEANPGKSKEKEMGREISEGTEFPLNFKMDQSLT